MGNDDHGDHYRDDELWMVTDDADANTNQT